MRKKWIKTGYVALIVFVLILCLSVSGWSAGFSLMLKGIKGLGTSFAGGAASADDASTIYYNPAGLALVPDNQILIYGQIILPSFEFSDEGSTTVLGDKLTGGDGGDAGTFNFLPGGFFSYALSDRLSLGIGVVSPFGLSSEYEADWKGRYHGTKSRVLTIDVNPTVAYKINDQWAVGLGVSAQYIDAELSQAVDYGTIFVDNIGPGPIEPQSIDGSVTLTANDWSFGYNLGVLFSLNEGTRFGFSYRSEVSYKLSGEASFDTPSEASLIASTIGYVDTGGSTQVDMPGSISISAYHQINDRWAIMGDINWTNWDVLDKLVIQFDTGAPDNIITYDWKNALRYAIGSTYQPNLQWIFRMGIALEETPVPNPRYRTPRIPDQDRYWISLGTGYRFSNQIVLDVGYSLLLSREADVDIPATGENRYRGAMKGSYKGHSNVFGAQIIWNF